MKRKFYRNWFLCSTSWLHMYVLGDSGGGTNL